MRKRVILLGMNRTHLFIATAAMSLSLGACSCGDDGTFSREGPGIEVSPEALAFGDVPLGAIAELALGIKNTGEEPLHICVEGTDLPAICDQVSEIQPTVGPFRVRFENLEEEDGSWAVAESQTRDL